MNEVFEKIVNRLFLVLGKPLKDAEKNAYKSLLQEYLGSYDPRDLVQALDKIITTTEMRRLPSIYEWKKHLPIPTYQESIACNACHKGLRSIAEKSQFGYWHAVTYSCTCEAGKRYTAFAPYQCSSCPAFVPFELPQDKSKLLESNAYQLFQETKQMLPICRADTFQPYDIKCLRWKKKLERKSNSLNLKSTIKNFNHKKKISLDTIGEICNMVS